MLMASALRPASGFKSFPMIAYREGGRMQQQRYIQDGVDMVDLETAESIEAAYAHRFCFIQGDRSISRAAHLQ